MCSRVGGTGDPNCHLLCRLSRCFLNSNFHLVLIPFPVELVVRCNQEKVSKVLEMRAFQNQ